jgi:hypothetical protein
MSTYMSNLSMLVYIYISHQTPPNTSSQKSNLSPHGLIRLMVFPALLQPMAPPGELRLPQ